MKYKLIALFIFNMIVIQNGFSQSDSLLGKKAMIFSFQGFNLGGGIGGKYQIGTNTAIRLQLFFSYSNSEYKDLDLSDPQSSNNKSNSYSFSPKIGIEEHIYSDEKVSLYYGGQLGVNQNYSRSRYQYPSHSTDRSEVQTSIIGGIFFGVEYWISKNISFAGEQSISVYSSVRENYSSFNVQSSASSLLLNVYF